MSLFINLCIIICFSNQKQLQLVSHLTFQNVFVCLVTKLLYTIVQNIDFVSLISCLCMYVCTWLCFIHVHTYIYSLQFIPKCSSFAPDCGELSRAAGGATEQLCNPVDTTGPKLLSCSSLLKCSVFQLFFSLLCSLFRWYPNLC